MKNVKDGKMKKLTAIAGMTILLLSGGLPFSSADFQQGMSGREIVIMAGSQRCTLCDGTGFGPDSQGRKGKGHYKCIRCKGTGRV